MLDVKKKKKKKKRADVRVKPFGTWDGSLWNKVFSWSRKGILKGPTIWYWVGEFVESNLYLF